MTYRVIVTTKAKIDIREAVDWWRENRSSRQAENWLVKIERALESLSESPDRCPVAPESDPGECPLHQLHFGVRRRATHRIVFAIEGSDVVILRVRHTARDDLAADDLR